MEIRVRGRHGQVPEGLRAFAHEKVGHLGKYLSTITSIDLELDRDGARTGNPFVIRLTVATSGPVFRSKATSGDAHSAIDMAVERVGRRVKEFKRRRSGRPPHARARVVPAEAPGDEGGSEELRPE
ncbi:MAG: ribosome hibernation-promoting factor, HPF/YfiA family [Actinomycetota bacterium]